MQRRPFRNAQGRVADRDHAAAHRRGHPLREGGTPAETSTPEVCRPPVFCRVSTTKPWVERIEPMASRCTRLQKSGVVPLTQLDADARRNALPGAVQRTRRAEQIGDAAALPADGT